MFEHLIQELEGVAAVDGLNMTDLLLFPENLRLFLNWMVRKKNSVQIEDIAGYIQSDPAETRQLLEMLIDKGFIEEIKKNDEEEYKLHVKSSRNYRVPNKIWEVFEG